MGAPRGRRAHAGLLRGPSGTSRAREACSPPGRARRHAAHRTFIEHELARAEAEGVEKVVVITHHAAQPDLRAALVPRFEDQRSLRVESGRRDRAVPASALDPRTHARPSRRTDRGDAHHREPARVQPHGERGHRTRPDRHRLSLRAGGTPRRGNWQRPPTGTQVGRRMPMWMTGRRARMVASPTGGHTLAGTCDVRAIHTGHELAEAPQPVPDAAADDAVEPPREVQRVSHAGFQHLSPRLAGSRDNRAVALGSGCRRGAEDPRRGARYINARAETVHKLPAFRAAFRRRRCLVPTNGWFERRRREGETTVLHQRRDRGASVLRRIVGAVGGRGGAAGDVYHRDNGRIGGARGNPRPAAECHPARGLRRVAGPGQDPRVAAGTRPDTMGAPYNQWRVSKRVNSSHNEGLDLVQPVDG